MDYPEELTAEQMVENKDAIVAHVDRELKA